MMDSLGSDPLHFGDPFLLKIGNPNVSLVGHMEIPSNCCIVPLPESRRFMSKKT